MKTKEREVKWFNPNRNKTAKLDKVIGTFRKLSKMGTSSSKSKKSKKKSARSTSEAAQEIVVFGL